MRSLVEDLRDLATLAHADVSVADEAADEIERLNKALYAIAHYEENTDVDYCEWYHALLNIARAALGEEKK